MRLATRLPNSDGRRPRVTRSRAGRWATGMHSSTEPTGPVQNETSQHDRERSHEEESPALQHLASLPAASAAWGDGRFSVIVRAGAAG